MNRRGFLLRTAGFAGAAGLVVLGLAGRARRIAARTVRIPFKPFERRKLRDPHDLAG
jgi:hypothetical protein